MLFVQSCKTNLISYHNRQTYSEPVTLRASGQLSAMCRHAENYELDCVLFGRILYMYLLTGGRRVNLCARILPYVIFET